MIETKWVDNPHGKFCLPADTPDCAVCDVIEKGGIYDRGICDKIVENIKPYMSVIDVGSCFGQMAVMFAKKIQSFPGSNAQVICFEANPMSAEIVVKNLIKNGCHGNAVLRRRIVWDESDKDLSFMTKENNCLPPNADFSYGCLGIDPSGGGNQWGITTVRIDDFNYDNICAIKIDAQGADLQVLRGAKETILRNKPAIVFEIETQHVANYGNTEQNYWDFVEEIGYELVETIGIGNYFIKPKGE